MYFVILFGISWVWFFICADKTRIRELYGVAIFASFLGLFTDLLMVHYKLWTYNGLPEPFFTIPLLLDFSIYPVVSYLFVQRFAFTFYKSLLQILLWTLLAGLFEYITLKTGHMQHHAWWNLWLSLASDIVIYTSLIGVYSVYSPAYKTENHSGSKVKT